MIIIFYFLRKLNTFIISYYIIKYNFIMIVILLTIDVLKLRHLLQYIYKVSNKLRQFFLESIKSITVNLGLDWLSATRTWMIFFLIFGSVVTHYALTMIKQWTNKNNNIIRKRNWQCTKVHLVGCDKPDHCYVYWCIRIC